MTNKGSDDTTTSTANAMWGGRFAAGPDAIMEAINASIGFDKRMARQDIEGSRAHAAMLAATGIVRDNDAEAIREGLLTVLSEIEAGSFSFSTALEDIHMNVEARLKELIGEPAGRLHTARSRNDQVALDFPELVIVGGHIGYPWTEEAIAVATKHEHVYIDTSAYTAKRYPAALVEFMRGHGRGKLLFGTNYPMITPAQALADLDALGLDGEARQQFLGGTACRVFGLDERFETG